MFLRYFLSPGKVIDPQKVEFNATELTGEANAQSCKIVSPKQNVILNSDLWLKSVGYKTMPMPGVPYDSKRFIVPNKLGCVVTDSGEIIKGLYVCGWAKRGPQGIIDATLRDTYETFRMIKTHLEQDVLDSKIDSTKNTIYNLDK